MHKARMAEELEKAEANELNEISGDNDEAAKSPAVPEIETVEESHAHLVPELVDTSLVHGKIIQVLHNSFFIQWKTNFSTGRLSRRTRRKRINLGIL